MKFGVCYRTDFAAITTGLCLKNLKIHTMSNFLFRCLAYGVGHSNGELSWVVAAEAWTIACALSGASPAFAAAFPTDLLHDPAAVLRRNCDAAAGYADGASFAVRIKHTAVWGSTVWRWLHAVAVTVDSSTAEQFHLLIRTVWALLPCSKCSAHFRDLVDESLPDLKCVQSGHAALVVTLHLHNRVSHRIYSEKAVIYPTTFTGDPLAHLHRLRGAGPSHQGDVESACNCE